MNAHWFCSPSLCLDRDTLGTKEKCVKQCREHLGAGLSVVVDNTNASAELRGLYTALARKQTCPVRCFHFVTPLEVAKHLNAFREKLTNGVHRHVPRIVRHSTSEDVARRNQVEAVRSLSSRSRFCAQHRRTTCSRGESDQGAIWLRKQQLSLLAQLIPPLALLALCCSRSLCFAAVATRSPR